MVTEIALDGIKHRRVIMLLIFFIGILFFRLSVNMPTHHETHFEAFRIGIIPWSDARGWVNGAENLLEGERISNIPGRRPLYPIFLAGIFSMLGVDYSSAIFFQIILTCLAVVAAYYILRDVRERLAVILFVTLLSLWRPTSPSVFMTENLAILILSISFALIWRGFRLGDKSDTCTGFFLLGLSQAVRPYAVLCLGTVPFVPFFFDGQWSTKLKYTLWLLCFTAIGYSLHPLASALFNESGTGSNFAMVLYGQVAGGKGWTSAYADPAIQESIRNSLSLGELNRIIYQRAMELFFQNPFQFIIAAVKSYKSYLIHLPHAFSTQYDFFILFFPLAVMSDPNMRLSDFVSIVKERPLLWTSIPFLFLAYRYLFLTFSAIGLMTSIQYRKDPLHIFLLLYLAGILLSLPLIGSDGGTRVAISSDIFVFLLASIGFRRCLGLALPSNQVSIEPDPCMKKGWAVMALVFFLFFVIPHAIKAKAAFREDSALPGLESEQISEIAGTDEPVVGPSTLRSLKNSWFISSQLKLDTLSDSSAYATYKFAIRDSVYFKAEEGINPNHFELWPMTLTKPKFSRTINTRLWTVFPNIEPYQLERIDNKEIVVIGSLVVNDLRWRYDTPYVIIVKFIGSVDSNGKLNWTELQHRFDSVDFLGRSADIQDISALHPTDIKFLTVLSTEMA
jgi:hypothetical protein